MKIQVPILFCHKTENPCQRPTTHQEGSGLDSGLPPAPSGTFSSTALCPTFLAFLIIFCQNQIAKLHHNFDKFGILMIFPKSIFQNFAQKIAKQPSLEGGKSVQPPHLPLYSPRDCPPQEAAPTLCTCKPVFFFGTCPTLAL